MLLTHAANGARQNMTTGVPICIMRTPSRSPGPTALYPAQTYHEFLTQLALGVDECVVIVATRLIEKTADVDLCRGLIRGYLTHNVGYFAVGSGQPRCI